ncbi:TIGR03790 family protein [Leptothermofonsia sp. ETS-13]|uniref:TIGR03790 family protein n=1 Tax=Leptothermofonsia sp. ETS-13 TaxID=3035696 RepID=UPI003BA1CC43
MTSRELAVVVNQADPLSVQIAEYYQQRRRIPPQNIVRLRFTPYRPVLALDEFKRLKTELDRKTPVHVQGFALTWAAPYRVGCMSITAAFAYGFDQRYCAKGCSPTQANPYFNQTGSRPYDDFQIRPAMAIAATNFAQAKALIDRGVASDGTSPVGTAYLIDTPDRDRNVRAAFYPAIAHQFADRFLIETIKTKALENKSDVMFYFTGLSQVPKFETNQFRPGAMADHLTSAGGMLTDSFQMSSLRWLEAGATGSYGTVVEPCNFPQKFPHPGIAMSHYLAGETLLEAYWKSVAWPGQGIFIGEPLARPFAGRG